MIYSITFAKAIMHMSSAILLGGNVVNKWIFMPAIRCPDNSADFKLFTFVDFIRRDGPILGGACILFALSHGYFYYLTKESLYLLGAICAAVISAFSVLVVQKDVEKLLDMAHDRRGREHMDQVFDEWMFKSNIRGYGMFGISYAILVWKTLSDLENVKKSQG